VGQQPSVSFPTPLITNSAERSVLTAGEGDEVGEYTTVGLELTVFDAATGEAVQGTAYSGTSSLYTAGESVGVFGDALLCTTVGSRIALIAPTEMFNEGYDPTAQLSGESIVVVVDVLQSWLGKANGVNQLPLDGMPTVVTAVNGAPGVAVSTQVPPTTERVSTIKAGAGATIADGDTAIIHIRDWSWLGDGSVDLGTIDSWSTGGPFRTTDEPVPAAVNEKLVGANVGSQLLIVVPGDGGGATIYVVDILGIDHVDE
jgi:peptidylprolyl isomerase